MNAFMVRTCKDRVEVVGPDGEVVRTWPFAEGDGSIVSWVAADDAAEEMAGTLNHGTAIERERILRKAGA